MQAKGFDFFDDDEFANELEMFTTPLDDNPYVDEFITFKNTFQGILSGTYISLSKGVFLSNMGYFNLVLTLLFDIINSGIFEFKKFFLPLIKQSF